MFLHQAKEKIKKTLFWNELIVEAEIMDGGQAKSFPYFVTPNSSPILFSNWWYRQSRSKEMTANGVLLVFSPLQSFKDNAV